MRRGHGPREAWRLTIASARERADTAALWFQDAARRDAIDAADSIRCGMQCANQSHQLMQQGLREREAAMFPSPRKAKP